LDNPIISKKRFDFQVKDFVLSGSGEDTRDRGLTERTFAALDLVLLHPEAAPLDQGFLAVGAKRKIALAHDIPDVDIAEPCFFPYR
jgi:hypothetical protein